MALTGDSPTLRRLLADWYSLGTDERRIICEVAGRLRIGRERHGTLELAGERRDWRGKAVEEALELVICLEAEELMREGVTP